MKGSDHSFTEVPSRYFAKGEESNSVMFKRDYVLGTYFPF